MVLHHFFFWMFFKHLYFTQTCGQSWEKGVKHKVLRDGTQSPAFFFKKKQLSSVQIPPPLFF